MAEIYSTFEVTGSYSARIGKPIEHHLHLLSSKPLQPLKQLFAVSRESRDYNEAERQGIFYSEAWLLTHYLMIGDNGSRKAGFGQLTALLRAGQLPEQAFTNALRTTLSGTERELRRYLERGNLQSAQLVMRAELRSRPAMGMRALAPVEVCFRLGDQLLRIGRLDSAEAYFRQAQKLAPRSPWSAEGLGLLAADRKKPDESVRYLREALQRGSRSFLAHYTYAREKYLLTAHEQERYSAVEKEAADEIRRELQKALALMPDFGPAHHLLGFFEMVQGENLAAAEQHLQRAIQLEPENPSYWFALAQAQLRKNDLQAAHRTLESLRTPSTDAAVRARAEELLREMDKSIGQSK
jgi:tetratricopeptide (TPR) repeat protein